MIQSGHVAEDQLITLSPEFVARFNELAAGQNANGDVGKLQNLQQRIDEQAAEIDQLKEKHESLIADSHASVAAEKAASDKIDQLKKSYEGRIGVMNREIQTAKSDYARAMEERDKAMAMVRGKDGSPDAADSNTETLRQNQELERLNEELQGQLTTLKAATERSQQPAESGSNSLAAEPGDDSGAGVCSSDDHHELLGLQTSLMQKWRQLMLKSADPECILDPSAIAGLSVEHLQSLVAALEAETSAIERRHRQNRALNRRLKRGRRRPGTT